MHRYEVLRRPLVTEKTTAGYSEGRYTFKVNQRANKLQVKEAVEQAFGVNVVDVNIINVPSKTHRRGRRVRRTPGWKKAMVKLAPGQRIEIIEGV